MYVACISICISCGKSSKSISLTFFTKENSIYEEALIIINQLGQIEKFYIHYLVQ